MSIWKKIAVKKGMKLFSLRAREISGADNTEVTLSKNKKLDLSCIIT